MVKKMFFCPRCGSVQIKYEGKGFGICLACSDKFPIKSGKISTYKRKDDPKRVDKRIAENEEGGFDKKEKDDSFDIELILQGKRRRPQKA